MLQLKKVKIKWSRNFAYAIGLLVTDGSLSKDGRHVVFTSKDTEQINNFQKCLDINYIAGKKKNGLSKRRVYYVVQIGDVNFYNFLTKIGLMANKTKIIGAIKVPKKYFFDFLRGHFDGDGSTYCYWDKRWKSSFMFYTTFSSASPAHIEWLREKIKELAKINGHITRARGKSCIQLKYAKEESARLFGKLYHPGFVGLSRKHLKYLSNLTIMNNNKGAGGETGRRTILR